MTPVEDFFQVQPPLPPGFPKSLTPPLTREFPESYPSQGCEFFLEQPNSKYILDLFFTLTVHVRDAHCSTSALSQRIGKNEIQSPDAIS